MTFLAVSPFAAIPLVFLLMLVVGDHAFGSSGAESGFSSLPVEAFKRTFAALYITIIYIAEHFLILGALLIVASYAFALLAARTRKFRHRAALAVLLSGVLYPTIWVIAEILDWDAGLFN